MEIKQITKRPELQNANCIVRNGHITPNESWRAIVFSKKTSEVQMVYKQSFHHLASEKGTWQICHEGDIVIKASRAKKKEDITLVQAYVLSSGNLSEIELSDSRIDLIEESLFQKGVEWINDLGDAGEWRSSFIPIS